MNTLEKAIFTALTAAYPSTGIYYHVAPPDAEYPFIVFNQQAETDSYNLSQRTWEELLYQVKVIYKAESSVNANSIADGIDGALTDAALTLDAGDLLYLRRVSRISYSEMSEGERYVHGGGLFRAWVRAS